MREYFHQHPHPGFDTAGLPAHLQNHGGGWSQSGYENAQPPGMYQQSTHPSVYPAVSQPNYDIRYAFSMLSFLISLMLTCQLEHRQVEDIPIIILFLASIPQALLFIFRPMEGVIPLDHPRVNLIRSSEIISPATGIPLGRRRSSSAIRNYRATKMSPVVFRRKAAMNLTTLLIPFRRSTSSPAGRSHTAATNNPTIIMCPRHRGYGAHCRVLLGTPVRLKFRHSKTAPTTPPPQWILATRRYTHPSRAHPTSAPHL